MAAAQLETPLLAQLFFILVVAAEAERMVLAVVAVGQPQAMVLRTLVDALGAAQVPIPVPAVGRLALLKILWRDAKGVLAVAGV